MLTHIPEVNLSSIWYIRVPGTDSCPVGLTAQPEGVLSFPSQWLSYPLQHALGGKAGWTLETGPDLFPLPVHVQPAPRAWQSPENTFSKTAGTFFALASWSEGV